MKTIRLPLTRQWFEMTKSGVKKEDYREIAIYWIKRFFEKTFEARHHHIQWLLEKGFSIEDTQHLSGVRLKKFDKNVMTLGYPKANNKERILTLEHKGIEIGYGKPEWGAKPNKLYFIIKHGEIL